VHACVSSHLVSTCTKICIYALEPMYVYISTYTSVAVYIHMYIFMQIDMNVQIQPNAEMVTQNLVSIPSNFILLPGVLGFSWDLTLVPCYYPVLIVCPMGRILVRQQNVRKTIKILCHPICIWLYHPICTYIEISSRYVYMKIYVSSLEPTHCMYMCTYMNAG